MKGKWWMMTKLKLRFMYIVLEYISVQKIDGGLLSLIVDLQKDIEDKLKEGQNES